VESIGRTLVIVGLMIAGLGAVLMLGGKIPWIGKLPGDILIERKNFSFYFPLATSILVSLLLSLVFWFLGRK
jgi:hypothetical protein